MRKLLLKSDVKKKDKKRKSKALDIKINFNKGNYFTKRITKADLQQKSQHIF